MKRRIIMKHLIKILSIIATFATNFFLTASTELAEQNSVKAKVEYCQHAEDELKHLPQDLKNTKSTTEREKLKKQISNLQHEEKECKTILKK